MRIPGLKGLRQSVRWLRSQVVGHAIILGYHRIDEAERDPYAMRVTPRHFAEQLEVLRQRARPISLGELAQRLREGNLPRRAVALTFDDGYADNLYVAKPQLECFEIPATVFVATGNLGRAFWWDTLAQILLSSERTSQGRPLAAAGALALAIAEHGPSRPDAASPAAGKSLLPALYEQLSRLPAAEQWQALAALVDRAGLAAIDSSPWRAMRPDEVIAIAQGGLIEVGAHTVNHPILASLSTASQCAEIAQGKSCLEDLIGRPVWGFSYPNGSFSKTTPDLVRDAGFAYACTSVQDVAWRGSDQFRLPRFWVPDWDGATFGSWLDWWMGD